MLEFINAENTALHIDSIYNILYKCGQDMYEKKGLTHWKRPYSKECIEKDICNKNVFLVSDDYGYVATFTVTLSDEDLYLSKLAVLPEYAGKGIGKLCMNYIERYAKERNISLMKLDVYDKSESAIGFYKGLGFSVTGKKPTTNFVVLLMEKRI